MFRQKKDLINLKTFWTLNPNGASRLIKLTFRNISGTSNGKGDGIDKSPKKGKELKSNLKNTKSKSKKDTQNNVKAETSAKLKNNQIKEKSDLTKSQPIEKKTNKKSKVKKDEAEKPVETKKSKVKKDEVKQPIVKKTDKKNKTKKDEVKKPIVKKIDKKSQTKKDEVKQPIVKKTDKKNQTKKDEIKQSVETKKNQAKKNKIKKLSTTSELKKSVKNKKTTLLRETLNEYGYITTVSGGIAEARGILKVKSGELVKIYPSNMIALALNLGPNKVGLVLCGAERFVNQTDIVSVTGTLISIKINQNILGSVVDALGFSLMSNLQTSSKPSIIMNVEQPAPDIISRQPIFEPLLTGITIIDSLVPIGRGQRELIIGDRQTGKTSIGIDTILNQSNVICVYVSIGQKCSGVAQLFRTIEKANKTKNLVIVSSTASDAAPLQYLAPYTGCTIAEYFRDNFGDATLVIYDDLSKQATAYRQLSLLLRRPPGREAFPGDVFYLHSRLLERAAKLAANLGGGSLTALPIVETQAGDVSAYIPTNVISITDGQIFLDAELFTQGVRPAVNVGLSVSRVGTAAQYPSLKGLSANIKLELAQYRDILTFVKFGSDIDEFTAQVLHRGERLVEIFKQHNNKPNITELQIILIAFATSGFLDDFSSEELKLAISFASYVVNLLFAKPLLIVLTYFFRYLNAAQINKVLKNLIGYIVTKNNKIK